MKNGTLWMFSFYWSILWHLSRNLYQKWNFYWISCSVSMFQQKKSRKWEVYFSKISGTWNYIFRPCNTSTREICLIPRWRWRDIVFTMSVHTSIRPYVSYRCILVGFLHNKFLPNSRSKYPTSAVNLLGTFLDANEINGKYPTHVYLMVAHGCAWKSLHTSLLVCSTIQSHK